MAIEHFTPNMRAVVTDVTEDRGVLLGLSGTIRTDKQWECCSAWLEIDGPLPPQADGLTRGRRSNKSVVLVWTDECESELFMLEAAGQHGLPAPVTQEDYRRVIEKMKPAVCSLCGGKIAKNSGNGGRRSHG